MKKKKKKRKKYIRYSVEEAKGRVVGRSCRVHQKHKLGAEGSVCGAHETPREDAVLKQIVGRQHHVARLRKPVLLLKLEPPNGLLVVAGLLLQLRLQFLDDSLTPLALLPPLDFSGGVPLADEVLDYPLLLGDLLLVPLGRHKDVIQGELPKSDKEMRAAGSGRKKGE